MSKPIIILGGGLWGSLLAYGLQNNHPGLDFKLVEKENHLGGNHTWSFNGSDVDPQHLAFFEDFINHSWEGYDVYFPQYARSFEGSYHSVLSEGLERVVQSALPQERVVRGLELSLDQALMESSFVIDARGLYPRDRAGFQKFLGLELELTSPHNLAKPVLMDVRIPQVDGFRFLYLLPFSPTRLLIEETHYSSTGDVEDQEFRARIKAELQTRGWEIKSIIREEMGSLPIPFLNRDPVLQDRVISLSGIFQDTTGYSIADALKLCHTLSHLKDPSYLSFQKEVSDYRRTKEKDRAFFRMLNRLLFRSTKPELRYKMLELFYRHPQTLVQKFYRGEMGAFDKLRFFLGKPPVPVMKAVEVILAGEEV